MIYKTTDLAIIIPTKDRPFQVKRHLESLVEQNCETGRIIIIASGEDIKEIVFSFKKKLPVEYYRSDPGQIKQRNLGISKLNNTTKLVATMDDDAIYCKNSIIEMINFWNENNSDIGGIGFNVVGLPSHKHTLIKSLLGFSVPEAGKILKSGWITPITNVSKNIKTEYLHGGTTVWKQTILKKNINHEINNPWAVIEDIMFSYPIGKKYPLYVSSKSKVKIEEIINDVNSRFYFKRGESFFLQGLYFIVENNSLSVSKFLINKFLHFKLLTIKGIILIKINDCYFSFGILIGFFKSLKYLFNIEDKQSFKARYIDINS